MMEMALIQSPSRKQQHTVILVWTTVALLALHIGGALKDQISGPPVFWRMLPFLRPPFER